jgi:nitrate/TMAO reductase-like tetraheme cytochrome c subunit
MKLSNIINNLKQFIIRRYILILLIVVPLGGVLFLGTLIAYNQSSKFCYSCHINEGPYSYIDKSRNVHKDVDKHIFSCIRCHKDKTVQTIYQRFINRNKKFTEQVANLNLQNIIDPKDTYKTEQCLVCHPDRLDVDEMAIHLMQSEKLKQIGLRFNKKLHHQFESFRDEDKARYEALVLKDNLSNEEKQEFEQLFKIKAGNCGQCHLFIKQEVNGSLIDKTVNFVARNPITCAGCHEDVNPIRHPGKPLSMPSEEICQKCHHGKIHGKFQIFKAECEDLSNTDNCVKCHPQIQLNVD